VPVAQAHPRRATSMIAGVDGQCRSDRDPAAGARLLIAAGITSPGPVIAEAPAIQHHCFALPRPRISPRWRATARPCHAGNAPRWPAGSRGWQGDRSRHRPSCPTRLSLMPGSRVWNQADLARAERGDTHQRPPIPWPRRCRHPAQLEGRRTE
jgi:hypothetical protein